jgi:phosphatidylglycerol:prolipoprotein diacylglycerol transferase
MLPILFNSPYIIIPAWHTFYMLGAIAAFFTMKRLARAHCPNLQHQFISQLFTIAYISGYFGARIFSIFVDEGNLTTAWDRLAALGRFGPMTFYGGFIGAIVMGSIFVLAKRKPLSDLLDISVPAGMIGLGIGRIGCFLNGDDFGLPVPTELSANPPWWSVTFPNLEDGVARYPVQLMETALVFLLAFIIMKNYASIRGRFGPGSVGISTIIGYGIIRFGLEYLRGDERGWVVEDVLSPSQLVSIVLVVGGIMSLFAVSSQRKHPATMT